MERTETFIEQSIEGKIIADELEEKLRLQGALRGRKDDTNSIILTAEYYMTVHPMKVPLQSEREDEE
jgi:hypothetical protein